jgi:Flp pilus assembly protein TadG
MNWLRNERGQVLAFTALSMTTLVAMAALVLDVGSWFRTKRQLQATADAAALAGAQALPDSPSNAQAQALAYANKNGGNVAASDIAVSSTNDANDTISVAAKKSQPGIFARVLGVNVVNIGARAKAITGTPGQVMYVAPMVVSCNHPLIQNCNGGHVPTYNQTTSLPFNPMGAPGAFGMLNLDNAPNGTVGSSTLSSWILSGYSKYLPTGPYYSDPGAKFNSNVQSSLNARVGTVLLFPVFDTLGSQGSNAQYGIIGWIGFHLTSVVASGTNATLTGYFTEYIAHGILPKSGHGSTNFGTYSVQLIG